MQLAVREVFRINSALKTRIIEKDDQVFQVEADAVPQEIKVLHFKNKKELDTYADTYAKEPFDLHGQLCEIQVIVIPNHSGILIKLHHIIGDAWTMTLIATQFYTLLNGKTPPAYPYTEHLEKEQNYLHGNNYLKDRAFFMEEFQKCSEITYLSEKQNRLYTAARKTFSFTPEQTKMLAVYAAKREVSAFVLFLTAFGILISRVRQNVEQFYLGTAFLNRFGVRDKNTTGMFVNTVPVLIELDYQKSFVENLLEIKAKVYSVLRHQKFHYSDTLAAIRKEYHFTEKLYDVMLSYQNAEIATADEIESTWYHNGTQAESLQLHIDDRDRKGIFCIHYDYQTEKFTSEQITHMQEHFVTLLFDAIKNDSKKLWELELLLDAEKQKLLFTFNDTAVDYPCKKCVHELFEEQVGRTPDRTALVFENESFTYRQIDAMSNSLANYLREQGIKPNHIVPIMAKRSWHIIVAMLGVLKAGAAYMPVDPDYPLERIQYMFDTAKVKIALTYKYDTSLSVSIVSLDNFDYCQNITPLSIVNRADDLCYVIFTSGSTGMPKGVSICHRNVVNYCDDNDYNQYHAVINKDCQKIVSMANFTFDMFTTDSLLSLLNGMTVYLANDKEAMLQSELSRLVRLNFIDVIQTTPTKMHSYMLDRQNLNYLKQFQVIILGGEALSFELLEELRNNTDARIYNLYGPTETTVWATKTIIKDNDITIGKPIANTQIYIVDQYMNLVPVGVTGELCIAGESVGTGYLNRPDLTAKKFIDNPFGRGKLYKTGDLAYWRSNGNIVYVGRNDFQVKIHGLRIELGEIENVICNTEHIAQSAVVVRQDETGGQYICAFYTVTVIEQGRKNPPNASILTEIKHTITAKLPRYMMPNIFMELTAMPMTPSGKIDRKALPEVDLHGCAAEEYIKPNGKLERQLAELMEQVLEYKPVGRKEDFFRIGGDSLKAIELVAKAHNEGIYFNLQDIFDYPTVETLGLFITKGDNPKISYGEADFTKTNKILARNSLKNDTVPCTMEIGSLLLTGATGFLGIHILADYLEHDSGTAYCIVRGESQEICEQRMKKLLSFYFGNRYQNLFANHRIVVIQGDLQKSHLDLTEQQYRYLAEKVDMVINAAANVKHYGAYQYFHEANVESVERLIAFCKQANAKLLHISTLSVSGNSFGNHSDGHINETKKQFYENSLYIGQSLDNVYARSKFEAEKAVLEAMDKGLHANIMRMGNLSNRLRDGVFQMNHESNATLRRIKGILDLGILPEYLADTQVEFTPIDEAAKAVMTIARHFSDTHTIFHINNTKTVCFRQLCIYLSMLGYTIDIVSDSVFADALRQAAEHEETAYLFETFINDMDTYDRIHYESSIHIENTFTEQYLNNLGFSWPETGLAYLRKYTAYFEKIGYFTRNKGEENDEKL